MKKESKTLKNKIFIAFISVLIAFAAVGTATFAWYIYNTRAHTTNLQMAAGTYSSLLISDSRGGPYGTSASEMLVGDLIPVSTDNILNGFQECADMRPGKEGEAPMIAYLFKPAEAVDYHKRSLYLKSGNEDLDVYINIGYDDSKELNPISTAIRVGVVTYQPGSDTDVDKSYIFAINPDQHVTNPIYNTENGREGCVLDSTKTDGSVVEFTPYTPNSYYKYNEETGEVDYSGALAICTCPGSSDGDGTPVKVDVYVWLEGCDSDCFGSVGVLSNLAFQFAGKARQ